MWYCFCSAPTATEPDSSPKNAARGRWGSFGVQHEFQSLGTYSGTWNSKPLFMHCMGHRWKSLRPLVMLLQTTVELVPKMLNRVEISRRYSVVKCALCALPLSSWKCSLCRSNMGSMGTLIRRHWWLFFCQKHWEHNHLIETVLSFSPRLFFFWQSILWPLSVKICCIYIFI